MNEQSRAFWKKLCADCVSRTYQYSALGARTQEFTPSVKPPASKMDHAEMLMDDIRQFKQANNLDRLVMVCENNPRFQRVFTSYPNFQDWQRRARSFQQIAVADRSLHRSQGTGALQQIGPSEARVGWLEGGGGRDAKDLFAGVDTSGSLPRDGAGCSVEFPQR